ncbi:MAG: hypothetical protein N2651_06355, partial [Fimbriimonadales bacterium]|nr:hypothetical protein [Fimbriimonadales bacterium]
MKLMPMLVVEAEFDGQRFVPREPVRLAAGERVTLILLPQAHPVMRSREERLLRYQQMLERFRSNPCLLYTS